MPDHAPPTPQRYMTAVELREWASAIDADHVVITYVFRSDDGEVVALQEVHATKADFLALYAPQAEAEDA